MQGREFFQLLKETFEQWNKDKVPRLGAALAYYAIFSLGPLLVIVLAVAGLMFGKEAASGQVAEEISGSVGPTVGHAVEELLHNASNPISSGWAALVGVATLLFGASGVFGQLQDALNTIWKVEPKPGRGILGVVRDRFLSFVMVLGSCFLLLVSLVLSAALSALSTWWTPASASAISFYFWQALNNLIAFGVIMLLFAMIYKVLPDVELDWENVWTGAAVTAVLFTMGKYLLGLYLGCCGPASAFGAAGSLVLILLWVYYSSQILLFGAEFTRVYTNRYQARVRPAPNAVLVEPASQNKMPV